MAWCLCVTQQPFRLHKQFTNLTQGKYAASDFLKIGDCVTPVKGNCLFCQLWVKLVKISNLRKFIKKKLMIELKDIDLLVFHQAHYINQQDTG